jgi:hypothetical protein
MYEDTKVSQLVINQLTEEKFKELLENDELDPNQLYCTDDRAGYTPPLLSTLWSDHLLNDISWLRADTFSWQSGDVYVAAYNHLAKEFKATSKKYYAWRGTEVMLTFYTERETPLAGDIVYTTGITENEWIEHGVLVSDYDGSGYLYFSSGRLEVIRSESEDFVQASGFSSDTIGDTTITYHRAEDGHKICLPDQEDKLLELYNKTGVAWYYILDEDNTQFKLPRTKYGFTGLRDSVGNYVPESLPNVTGTSGTLSHQRGASDSFDGALYNTYGTYYGEGSGSNNTGITLHLDASISSPTYQDGAPVQERATQTYLYFYVGNFERDAVEQTAGIVAEMFNNKADSDLGNIPTNYDYVVESQLPTAENGYTWYRKYKSGWVEQGGIATNPNASGTQNITVSMPVEMADTYYNFVCSTGYLGNDADTYGQGRQSWTTTDFVLLMTSASYGTNKNLAWWQVCGMSA